MITQHAFDQALALDALGAGRYQAHTSNAYANMVGPFGGVTAAQLLQGLLLHPEREGEPVALTVNFCAAIADGGFVVEARPVRTNRSTQHWTLDIVQDGQVAATATALTAKRRPTWGTDEHSMPAAPEPGAVAAFAGPYRVEWLKQYELRYLEGAFPAGWDGRDHGHSRTRLWLRDAPARPLDFTSLCAMCDVFFPRVWLRRASFVPLGTVTLTIYFHADAACLARVGTGYVQAQAQGQGFRQNFFDHTGQVWSADGGLLATTHSLYYFKS